MQKITLRDALGDILGQDDRYSADAYLFVKQALDHSIRILNKPSEGAGRHVSASELLEGLRQFALAEFGPMAMTVLTSWGLKSSQDIGNVVFNMVRQGILGKNNDDRIEDFNNGYDFAKIFREPFLPTQALQPDSGSPGAAESKPAAATSRSPEH